VKRDRLQRYLVLLRGINVGGKNSVSMANLKAYLEDLGFVEVSTFIASGNVFLSSEKPAADIQAEIEDLLPRKFHLDSDLIRVLVLTHRQLKAVVEGKPKGFGDAPGKYHSDAVFLMGVETAEAMPVFDPREGVDRVWPGKGVVYSQRLSAQRTRSRLNRIMASPLYKSMTIRSWSTTVKLLGLMETETTKSKAAVPR
jgi:uncharacterized protein (DUF1697 family)